MPIGYIYKKIKNTLRKIDMKLERAKYSYIDKMPRDIEYFDGGLYDVVYESSCKWPHNIALQYFDTEITYKEMVKKIDKVAAALKQLGAEKGDRITAFTAHAVPAAKQIQQPKDQSSSPPSPSKQTPQMMPRTETAPAK